MDNLLLDCKEYDPDKDFSGAVGMDLAQRVYQKTGGFDVKDLEEIERFKMLEKIAFRKFPPLLPGETILVRELKQRFKELKKAGYDIEPYSRLTKEESWNYLAKIKRDIASRVINQ